MCRHCMIDVCLAKRCDAVNWIYSVAIDKVYSVHMHYYIVQETKSKIALISLKPCFYNWIETTSTSCWHNDGTNKDNLHFDDQSKQVDFLVSIEL